MEIAIVSVAYNRVNSLKRLLNSLEKAFYDNFSPTLIISVDKSNTNSVEKFADEYYWPHGEKIVDKHEQNMGLRPHMLSLGKWFNRFDAIIVLEDDIVVSPSFYRYTLQTVEKYQSSPDVAGISLYGFDIDYQTGFPFQPMKDENDVYFMNCAISWGEVWMRESWLMFYDWYQCHNDFPVLEHLPRRICNWNNKSWLKYHTRYCIEENKFFVHPYVSLSTNFGDAGEHNSGAASTVYQVGLQQGIKKNFELPEFGGEAVYYDGFFENMSLYKILGVDKNDLCIDLNGEWNNRLNKRYWLTTEVKDFHIVKSYGLNYRPIEVNVLLNNPGSQIFLYDTQTKEKNPHYKNRSAMPYFYHISNCLFFLQRYGIKNLKKDLVDLIKRKFNK